jgi:hypothetical protein
MYFDLMLVTPWLFVGVAVASTIGPLVERARMRAGVAHKELALSQGISPVQWSRQLAGHGHVALDRVVTLCPTTFVAALLEEIAASRGLHLEQVFHLRGES